MIDSKIENQFINWLYDEYCKKFGYGIRNIDNCPFNTTYSCEHLPVEFYEVNNGIKKSHVIQYAKELEAKEHIRFDENGYQFYFTKKGYNSVSKNLVQKTLDFLNENPGLWAGIAILISLASMAVSILGSNNEH